MNTQYTPASDQYGPVCPHCSTAVPRQARICTGCGAVKSMRGLGNGPGEQLPTFFVWLPTVGAAIGISIWATMFGYDQCVEFFHRHDRFSVGGLVPFAGGLVMLCGSWMIAYTAIKVWRKVFGSSTDAVWARKR